MTPRLLVKWTTPPLEGSGPDLHFRAIDIGSSVVIERLRRDALGGERWVATSYEEDGFGLGHRELARQRDDLAAVVREVRDLWHLDDAIDDSDRITLSGSRLRRLAAALASIDGEASRG